MGLTEMMDANKRIGLNICLEGKEGQVIAISIWNRRNAKALRAEQEVPTILICLKNPTRKPVPTRESSVPTAYRTGRQDRRDAPRVIMSGSGSRLTDPQPEERALTGERDRSADKEEDGTDDTDDKSGSCTGAESGREEDGLVSL
jgi:hypothetical protein